MEQTEAARTYRANKLLEARPCASCGQSLALGDECTVCSLCSAAHHASCWQTAGGCATPTCQNAPLRRLAEVPPVSVLPEGAQQCPACGERTSRTNAFCPRCNTVLSPDGLYHGPTENAPGAVAALVWGIVSLFFCGIITGWLAISKSKEAKMCIAADPRYGGGGMATAGYVLGILGIVLTLLTVVVKILGAVD